MPKCCNNEDNLEYIRAHSCWPYEIWGCKECNKEYDVELIRDFKNKEKKMNGISVSINKRNLNKILHYAQAAYDEHKAEIGGMAVCVKGEDNEWEIKDPIILKQDITSTNCALDKEELADYYVSIGSSKKYKNKNWRFLWWHSHHTMDSFWSGTDLAAIEEFNQGDLSFALVVNLKGDYLVRASAWNLGMHQDMDLNVEEQINNVPKKILDEVNDKCSTRTFVGKGYSSYNTNQLALYKGVNPNKSNTLDVAEENKFSDIWAKVNELIEEQISKVCAGETTIKKAKQEFARSNGKLTKNNIGIRIEYGEMTSMNDVMMLKGYDLIEVEDKFSALHEELIQESEDFYSYNWSYGLNRRYN